MLFKGPLAGGVSQNGYQTDILKSALQKYVRRGETQKALYSCWELELFHNLIEEQMDDTKRRNLKGFLTNIINRLLIISVEDVGIGFIGVPTIVNYAYREYKKGDESARRRALHTLVITMCECQKSRELSHINCVYGQVLNSNKKEEYMEKYPEIYRFDMNIGNYVAGFIKLYNQGQDGCFYYLIKQLHEHSKQSILPMLMHVIDTEKDYKRKEIMKSLQEWYKEYTFKEFFIFAYQIVLIGLRKELYVDMDYINSKIHLMNDANNKLWEDSYQLNLEGRKMEIDDYAIDKHTREGKRKGKGLKEFANEGCHVENEHPIVNQQYKEIYVSFRQTEAVIEHDEKQEHPCEGVTKTKNPCKNKGKYLHEGSWYCSIHNPDKADSVEKVKAEAEQLCVDIKHNITEKTLQLLYMGPRGQLMTGKHKKQVFIPVEGTLAGKVVKGPWYSSDITKLNKMIFRLNEAKKWDVSCLPFLVVSGADKEMYTLYKNLSSIDVGKWLFDEKHDPYITYPECVRQKGDIPDVTKIIQRESLGIKQLHKCDRQIQNTILFGDQFLFKGIVLMAILKVGDMGPYNILVTEKNRGWIVDYDENTTKKEFLEIGHLYAKSAKCYTDQFTQGIKQNKQKVQQMIEEFDKEYSEEERWQQIKGVIEQLM